MVQYIEDISGQATAVQIQIPIEQWNNIRNKYEGIESELTDVPEWQKEIVRRRVKNYNEGKTNLVSGEDFFKKFDLNAD